MTRSWNAPAFAVLQMLAAALWWLPLSDTVRLALSDDAYTHILLIVPVGLSLLHLERRLVVWKSVSWDGLGVACLAVALALRCFYGLAPSGVPEEVRLCLSMVGLVTWWIGSFILFSGRETFKALLFPLCFLFWIVPLPSVAMNEVIYFLQRESTLAARLMFSVAGVPVTQDGVMLSLPNIDIEVARECSSIRSSTLLVIVTCILAHLFLRSWWRKALLIASAIPLAAVKNGFRIFVITELGTKVDPGFFEGSLHRRGGIVFLGVAMGLTLALLWVLQRTETAQIPRPQGQPPA